MRGHRVGSVPAVFRAVAAAICCVYCLIGLSAANAGQQVVHIYTWSDYFDSEVLRDFERQFKCQLAIDYFDSNESMYAKLKVGGGGYDIITPSSYMSALMDRQDMLEELDHSLLPNLEHIDHSFIRHTEDPDLRYSVPYTRTVTGVGFNSRLVRKEDLGSWDIFGKSRYYKRMTMLNDMRESIGAALKFLGYSLNTTDDKELEEACAVLVSWKKNLAKFDVDDAKMGLASGEFQVIHGYNGDVALIMDELPEIDFYVPEEGSSMTSDDFVIAKGSPNVTLAHAFVNYIMDPEVARKNMESIRYYMPNPAAVEMLDPDLRDNDAFAVPDDVLDKCEVIRDLGENNEKYIKVWDIVKSDE